MSVPWSRKTLAEVCEIKPPKSDAKRNAKDSDLVSFVPMEDLGIGEKFLEPKAQRKLSQVAGSYTYFADGDVLLAKITPCFENGKLGIARGLTNGIGFGSSEYIVFRPANQLSNEYLYYFLLQDSFRSAGIQTMSGAVGHKRVSREFIERFQIPLPPLPEQQRIVAILDEAFAGLATTTANAEQNLNNARELFESCLNEKMVAQAHRAISQTLLSVCELIVDCEHKTAPTQPEGIASIRTPNIGKGELILEGVNRVSEDTFKIWSRRAVPREGDLIFAREATAGNVAVIPPMLRCVLGQRTVLIRPNGNVANSKYLAYLLLHPAFQSKLLGQSKGATVQHVNMKDIRALGLGTLPSLNEQRRTASEIVEIAQRSKELEDCYQQKLKYLAALKQTLLQKAFSGELTGPPSQAIKEAAE